MKSLLLGLTELGIYVDFERLEKLLHFKQVQFCCNAK